MPVLERMVQFTSLRHKEITNNIANINTPNFQPRDLSVEDFQKTLTQAIDKRRSNIPTGPNAQLKLNDTSNLRFNRHSIEARTTNNNRGIMYHDRNNRSVDELMKDLAINTMAHNAALDMLHNQFQLLDIAIRERL